MNPVHVVLGATGGIGRAVARQLTEAGASVIIAARDSVALDRLAAEIDATPCLFDGTDLASVEEALETAVRKYDRLDGVANCVGSLLLKPAHLTTGSEWDEVIATHLRSSFAAVRAAAPRMRKQGGSIVLISSAAARIGLANHEAIAAAKAGIEGLAKSAAATYANAGVRVNVVAPGLVRTKLTERITGTEAAERASLDLHPLGRLGEADDVARAITWLLDPAQSWVTSQVIGVDGGLGGLKTRPRAR